MELLVAAGKKARPVWRTTSGTESLATMDSAQAQWTPIAAASRTPIHGWITFEPK
jgi:hypothetical protein